MKDKPAVVQRIYMRRWRASKRAKALNRRANREQVALIEAYLGRRIKEVSQSGFQTFERTGS